VDRAVLRSLAAFLTTFGTGFWITGMFAALLAPTKWIDRSGVLNEIAEPIQVRTNSLRDRPLWIRWTHLARSGFALTAGFSHLCAALFDIMGLTYC
jgi:hypothetical protein